jgi:hypothetical protein
LNASLDLSSLQEITGPTATVAPVNSQFSVSDALTADQGKPVDEPATSSQNNAPTPTPARAEVTKTSSRPPALPVVTPSALKIVPVSPATSLLEAFRLQPPTFNFALLSEPLGAPQQQSLFDGQIFGKEQLVAATGLGKRFDAFLL